MTTTVIACLVSFILGVGGMGVYDHFQPPKTVIQNITTTQSVETRSVQTVDQSQLQAVITANGSFTNFNFNWHGKTNFSFSVKTNRKSKTNK